ncbi:MAG: glycoside hydrolase family 26 protein, partial [Oscillospiraceae bacterium]|nr:glycoside hydrolase family 26 protein [Oscillospiraceae bacterium]
MKGIKLAALLTAACMLITGCGGDTSVSDSTAESSQLEIISDTISGSPEESITDSTESNIEAETYNSRFALSNPNADVKTRKLYDYINDVYGKYIITCQQESTWMGSPDYEMDYIFETTGKYPAMRGLDFMKEDFSGVVQRSKEWHEKGGIVTICWHTGVNGKGYQEALDDTPNFDKLLTEGTEEYNAMIANWDQAAEALQELRDTGIPVLWRPFHEFDGQWFWWGKGGADNFIKLWQMMYDRFTNEFGLTNLIWVLGYS